MTSSFCYEPWFKNQSLKSIIFFCEKAIGKSWGEEGRKWHDFDWIHEQQNCLWLPEQFLSELQLTGEYLISLVETTTVQTRILLFQSGFLCWQNGGKPALLSFKVLLALQMQPPMPLFLVSLVTVVFPHKGDLRTSATSLKNRQKV